MPQFNQLAIEKQPDFANQRRSQTSESSKITGPRTMAFPKPNFDKKIFAALGPDPDWALNCFVDLGLSDPEIARYVGLPLERIQVFTRPFRASKST